MMDEPRYERRDDLDEPLHGERELRLDGIERRERFLDETAGELNERERARRRREHEDVPRVDPLAAHVVDDLGVEADRSHVIPVTRRRTQDRLSSGPQSLRVPSS